jgi:hypothetical protein
MARMTKYAAITIISRLTSLTGSALAAAACSDATTVLQAPTTPGADPEAPPSDEAEPGPAILLAGLVAGVDGYTLYISAEPEIPSGDFDYSRSLEISATDSYAYTSGGAVFVWEGESLRMRRFDLGEDLALEEGQTLGFSNEVPGASNHVFVSATRAYSLSTDLDRVVVWNPETMEITGRIEVPLLDRPEGMTSFAYWGRGDVVGDRVIWEIVSSDDESNVAYPATTLAIASATDEEPVHFIEDDRCTGGGGGRADASGDYYVRSGAMWGRFAALGEGAEDVRTCVLRLNAGDDAFDPDYLVDFRELTGSYVNYPWFHVSGSQYVAHVWPSETPLPETLDDFYASDAATHYEQLLVDVDEQTAEPYPYLEGGSLISSDEFKIDGVSYYQLSETGYVEGGSTDVVELHPEGIERRFHVPGSLWALARIR